MTKTIEQILEDSINNQRAIIDNLRLDCKALAIRIEEKSAKLSETLNLLSQVREANKQKTVSSGQP